jgi:ubiquinone/menaquinone biosynthesis C-methylase UbiE
MSSKQYFDDVANQWDTMRTDFFQEAVREQAIKKAGIQATHLAVDMGAGTGFVTAGLIEAGAKVIAVDQSPVMLETMKSNFPNTNKIDYRVGDAENLPIESDSVDYVFANMYLHHVETPQIAIQEMSRILKSGGKLIITDLDEHTHEWLRTEQFDRWLGFNREDIQQWFEGVGLTNVNIDCTDQNCCASSETSSDDADVSIFLAYGEKV